MLRVLAKGCSFDAVYELNNISAEANRVFFHSWVHKLVANLGPTFIKIPKTAADVASVVNDFAANGFPGCIGSIDCVHIRWDNCPAMWRNLYKGKNSYPTISYEVTVAHDKTILFSTVGHYGTRNDKTIVRFDGMVQAIHQGGIYDDMTFELYQCDGTIVEQTGYYLICDGGYHQWRCLQCGFSQPLGESDSNYSSHIGSVRKDVECCFGILKIRFRILRSPIIFKYKVQIDNVFKACCILHNMLKSYDTSDDRDLGDSSDDESDNEDCVTTRRTVPSSSATKEVVADAGFVEPISNNENIQFGAVEFTNTEKGAGFTDLRKMLREHVNYLKMTHKIKWTF